MCIFVIPFAKGWRDIVEQIQREMTVLFNHEKAVLRYNAETNSIELIWKKFQDEATYKMMFTKGLEAIKETKATGWLSDYPT